MRYIQKCLHLSTDHIPFSTVNTSEDFGSSRVCSHQYGWIVFLDLAADQNQWQEIFWSTPDWFYKILSYAYRKHCSFICFDDSAPIDPQFPIYIDLDPEPTDEFPVYTGELIYQYEIENAVTDYAPVPSLHTQPTEVIYEETLPSAIAVRL